jgi:tripartite-type tricarboxylate transporter receptor subunit TctC
MAASFVGQYTARRRTARCSRGVQNRLHCRSFHRLKERNLDIRFKRLALVALTTLASAASAQEWPAKPIRVVVPYTPGGVAEAIFRPMAPGIEQRLNQRLYIDNKPGADGTIGTGDVARAAPDGYSILLAPTANYAVTQHMYRNLGFDPLTSLDPVGTLCEAPLIITVSGNVSSKNLKEFIDLIKANPGKYNYGSPGSGSPAHLTMAQISQSTGNSMVYVPFKGTAPLVLAMLSGDVHVSTYSLTAVAGQLKAGKMRALAITSAQRMADIPDVPTTAEAGFPQYNGTNWWVVSVPHGTPARIVDRLWGELRVALGEPEVRRRINETGHVVTPKNPAETMAFLKAESARYKKIVEDGKITAD